MNLMMHMNITENAHTHTYTHHNLPRNEHKPEHETNLSLLSCHVFLNTFIHIIIDSPPPPSFFLKHFFLLRTKTKQLKKKRENFHVEYKFKNSIYSNNISNIQACCDKLDKRTNRKEEKKERERKKKKQKQKHN